MENKIRKLAKSSYWQSLYNASKESSVQIFENNTNLSGIQSTFYYWLGVYNMLYEELSKFEDDYLTNDVINNYIRCDAYIVYRNKKIKNEWKKYKQQEKLDKIKSKHPKIHNRGKTQLIDVDLRGE